MNKLIAIFFFIFFLNALPAMEEKENRDAIETDQDFTQPVPNFSNLPVELKMIIASFLIGLTRTKMQIRNGIKELKNLAKVNKELYDIINSEVFIKLLMSIKSKNMSFKTLFDMASSLGEHGLDWLKSKSEESLEIKKYLNLALIELLNRSSIITNGVFIRIIINAEKEIKLLIKAGADIDCKNERGKTPLIIASRKGDEVLVELLIKLGANLNAIDDFEGSALINALDCNQKEMAKMLIEYGADVNIKDIWDFSALMLAQAKFLEEIEEMLIKAGAQREVFDISWLVVRTQANQNRNRR